MMLIAFLKYKPKKYRSLFIYLLIVCISCDPVRYFSLSTKDNRFLINDHEKKYQILEYSSNSFNMRLLGNTLIGYVKKEQNVRNIFLDIFINSKMDFTFDAQKTYLISNSNDTLMPRIHGVYRKDNFYKKDKEHDIGIIFDSDTYITLPATLYLPPIQFIDTNEEFVLPEIVME